MPHHMTAFNPEQLARLELLPGLIARQGLGRNDAQAVIQGICLRKVHAQVSVHQLGIGKRPLAHQVPQPRRAMGKHGLSVRQQEVEDAMLGRALRDFAQRVKHTVK